MKVLLISGLTGRISNWIQPTTRYLVRAVADAGGNCGCMGDVPIPASPQPEYFVLDYPPGEKAEGQIRAAVEAFGPDLIHVTCGGISLVRTAGRVARSAKGRAIPWIFTAHNIPPAEKHFTQFLGHNRLHYLARNLLALPSTLAWRRTLGHGDFDTVILHSQTVVDRAIAARCPREKIRLILLGADAPAPPPPAAGVGDSGGRASPFLAGDFPKVLCVAGMIHHKGQHDLVRAAEVLRESFPKLKVVLLGAARSQKYPIYLQELVRRLKLEQTVSFAHRAPDQVRAAAWAEADLYVQPSHEEGFCLSFLEGVMAVPRAIGTATGAMAEIAGEDPLIRIIAPGEPRVLAEAARSLLALPASRQMLAERRERLARSFSWDRYIAEHAELYRRYGGGSGRAATA